MKGDHILIISDIKFDRSEQCKEILMSNFINPVNFLFLLITYFKQVKKGPPERTENVTA